MDRPRDGDANDVWILWRLERVEAAVDSCTKAFTDMAVTREQINTVTRRMDALDARAGNVGRAMWGLAATIMAALVVFILTGVH